MKYPAPIPSTPPPRMSDILRRGMQMDPINAAPRAVAHLAGQRRLMSPTSALGRAWRTRNEESGFTAAAHAAR